MFPSNNAVYNTLVVVFFQPWCIQGNVCRSKLKLTNTYEHDYGSVIRTIKDAPSVTACSDDCAVDLNCRSFIYEPGGLECRLNQQTSKTSPTTGSTQVNYGYFEKSTCRPAWMFEGCSSDDQCAFPNSLCENGVCRCNYGYSYDYRHDTCVTECSNYGTMYNQVPYYIYLLNDAEYSTTSLADCRTLCETETAFVCRFLEFDNQGGDCYLSSATGLTHPNAFKFKDENWTMLHRECA